MNTTHQHHKSIQTQSIYDVIISGAGPVGLFLACELALAKCSVLVLEKAADPHSPLKQMPFGIRGLSSLSIETLYRRNMFNELQLYKRLKSPHQNAGEGSRRQVGHFAGIPFHEGDIDASHWQYRLPSATPTSLMSEMQELESIFAHRAEALGVVIKRGMAITGYEQTEEEVTVQAGDQSFRAKWLVGCDGARSAVRKLGNFEFAGTEPQFTGYTAKVDIADPEKLKPGRNVTPNGMYMQSQPGYLMIQDFDAGAFHSSDEQITLQHLQEVLRRISSTDVTLTALHAATTWTDRARQATAYLDGRTILAGDAAHIHAPLGGQGLNLGLGDAMNLGWKLAATIHNKAPEGLLDTYFTERHPIGVQVLDWSRAQVYIMEPTPQAQAMHAVIRDLMNTPDGATYFAGRVWGINTQYNLGGNHPLIGRSTPNFELEDGTTIGDLMHNGLGILLDFRASDSLKTLAGQYGDQLKYVTGHAKEQLGLSAVLIRPDGIVAWLAEDEVDQQSIKQAIAHWFKQ
ncbi:FAD-dependent monooxygenase [Mucilaginibacter jinjuensis]|uniref:FAD-dependent monooxygenase n=1 Tax=Mucilaginibacter jinjuensis TaxID=1176721 RepID=A0ABY7T540_9SPHI|nr:FAD-dependent monooxygenase [Mucilaginibacter jinjuensis]WCT11579.1 FAD-dependent monooxygenase [Mucilaginibacter jinjuensis]